MKVRATEAFSDRNGEQRWEGDVFEPDKDEYAQRLVESGMCVPVAEGDTEAATDPGIGVEYRDDYRAAQQMVQELGLDIPGNSPHRELVEAIEEAK